MARLETAGLHVAVCPSARPPVRTHARTHASAKVLHLAKEARVQQHPVGIRQRVHLTTPRHATPHGVALRLLSRGVARVSVGGEQPTVCQAEAQGNMITMLTGSRTASTGWGPTLDSAGVATLTEGPPVVPQGVRRRREKPACPPPTFSETGVLECWNVCQALCDIGLEVDEVVAMVKRNGGAASTALVEHTHAARTALALHTTRHTPHATHTHTHTHTTTLHLTPALTPASCRRLLFAWCVYGVACDVCVCVCVCDG